jgi:hypothetical protein
VADYESVVAKISNLQESLEKDKEYLEMAIKELEEKKTTWMPKINEITTTVSEKFAEMFANIGHVGEVSLFEHEVCRAFGCTPIYLSGLCCSLRGPGSDMRSAVRSMTIPNTDLKFESRSSQMASYTNSRDHSSLEERRWCLR